MSRMVLEWIDGVKVIREMKADEEPQIDLTERKAAALSGTVARCDEIAAQATAGYVRMEIAAWPAKAADARAVVAGGDPSLLLEVEAEALGVPVADLAVKITQKAEVYETLIAKLAAIRQKAAMLFDAAPDVAVLQTSLETVYAELSAL